MNIKVLWSGLAIVIIVAGFWVARNFVRAQVPPGTTICIIFPDLCLPPPPAPDLVTEGLSWTPVSPVGGDQVTFSGAVRNQGGTTTGVPSTARFCVDNPSCLTSSVGQVGEPAVPILGALTSHPVTSTTWTAIVGSHTVYLCADVGAVVTESDERIEESNCSSLAFSVAAPPPGIAVKGNIHSGGQIRSESKIRVEPPSVVTASGNVIEVGGAPELTITNYTIDTSIWRAPVDQIIRRLQREVAPVCNFSQPLAGVCRTATPPSELSGTAGISSATSATIIIEPGAGNDPIRIADIAPARLGVIVEAGRRVWITGSAITGVAVFAPDSEIEFTNPARALALRGIFIGDRFTGLDRHSGRIDYDPTLVRTPPPGMGQLLLPLVREQVP